ncbi:MAG: hypothetical protein QME52_01535 [Bacteroidota bacterium]|nr:hypothetical protein [Bacteroidota bacterium]
MTFRSIFPNLFGFGFSNDADIWLVQPYSRLLFSGSLRAATYDGTIFNIGYFTGGQSLVFAVEYRLVDENGYISTHGPYYQEAPEPSIIGCQTNTYIFFDYHITPVLDTATVWQTMEIFIDMDSNSCVDMRPSTGPPREPQPFIVPSDTQLLYYPWSLNYPYHNDSLWFHSKNDSLYFDKEFYEWYYPPINLGKVKAGDTIIFSLISVGPGTEGERMYPRVEPDREGWNFYYESWIDDCDDYGGSLWFSRDRYRVYAAPQRGMPGDTLRLYVEAIGEPEDPNAEVDVNIIEGRNYATLIDTSGTVYGNDIFYRPYSRITNELQLVIGQNLPPSGRIIVQVLSEEDWFSSGRVVLEIGSCPNVSFCPPAIATGDTSDIIVKKQRFNGDIVPYPDDQEFDVHFFNIADTVYGKLLDPCDQTLKDSLLCTLKGFKYVASLDTAPPENYLIKFLVEPVGSWDVCEPCQPAGLTKSSFSEELSTPIGTMRSGSKNIQLASASVSKQGSHARRTSDYPSCSNNGLTIREYEIILGETKYFKVTKCEDTKSLVIDTTSHGGRTNDLEGGESEADWSVEKADARPKDIRPGTRIGAYWETKKVAPDFNGTPKLMPDGLIRVIGRYWHADSVYRVKLTSKLSGYKDAHAIIEVKKPRKLGSALDPTVEDVFGNQIMINDTIIKYAGIYGIPPQIIKGQIAKETHFEPVYRYEFNEDIKYRNMTEPDENGGPSMNEKYFGSENNFVVNSPPPMGNGPAIPSKDVHKYVKPIGDYPRNQITIRNYLIANRYQYIKRDKLRFMNDDEITNQWNYYYDSLYKKGVWSDDIALQNEALSKAVQLLSDGIIGKKEYDWYAQTRIIASYGFLQLTHYNATDLNLNGFTKTSSTQPPEYLNEVSYGFPAYGERMYKHNQIKQIVWNGLQVNNWPLGYEKTWESALNWYNHGEPNYEVDVMNNAKNYLPVKGE